MAVDALPAQGLTWTSPSRRGYPSRHAYPEGVRPSLVAATLATILALGVAVGAAVMTLAASEPPPAPHTVVDVEDARPLPTPSPSASDDSHDDDSSDDDHSGEDDDDD